MPIDRWPWCQWMVVALSVVLAVPATASEMTGYREGMPPVLQAPAEADQAEILKAVEQKVIQEFHAKYAASGSPRIVLFWNVEFTDDVANQEVQTTEITGGTSETRNELTKQTTGGAESAELTDGESHEQVRMKIQKYAEESSPGKRTLLVSEKAAWRMETAFIQTLREADVRLIDRATIIRTTAAEKPDDKINTQRIETSALVGKADMYLEVLMTRDMQTPFGVGVKVSLKDIGSGEQVAAVYSTGMPGWVPEPTAHYAPTGNGYEKVTDPTPPVTVDDIGRRIALTMMVDVKDKLKPRSKGTGR